MEVSTTVKVSVPLSEDEEAMLSELESVETNLDLGQLYVLVKAAFVEGRIVGESWTDSASFKRFATIAEDLDAAVVEVEEY